MTARDILEALAELAALALWVCIFAALWIMTP